MLFDEFAKWIAGSCGQESVEKTEREPGGSMRRAGWYVLADARTAFFSKSRRCGADPAHRTIGEIFVAAGRASDMRRLL